MADDHIPLFADEDHNHLNVAADHTPQVVAHTLQACAVYNDHIYPLAVVHVHLGVVYKPHADHTLVALQFMNSI